MLPDTPDGYAAVKRVFGNITSYIRSDGTISPRWEVENIVRIVLPAPLPYSANAAVKLTRLAVHKLIAPAFKRVYQELWEEELWEDLENCGGAYSFRAIRGRPDRLSLHSFGIAVDHDTIDNPLGLEDPSKMHPKIVKIFEGHGFFWGGKFQGRKDMQHFQYATGA